MSLPSYRRRRRSALLVSAISKAETSPITTLILKTIKMSFHSHLPLSSGLYDSYTSVSIRWLQGRNIPTQPNTRKTSPCECLDSFVFMFKKYAGRIVGTLSSICRRSQNHVSIAQADPILKSFQFWGHPFTAKIPKAQYMASTRGHGTPPKYLFILGSDMISSTERIKRHIAGYRSHIHACFQISKTIKQTLLANRCLTVRSRLGFPYPGSGVKLM